MFPTLSEATQDELSKLTQRYGQPLVRTVDLNTTTLFDPLNKTDRYGEVCMVVRRRDGRLLTSKKTHYPADAFRLLTGGINHGEAVFDALLRETYEETGLEVRVNRFLAAAAYLTQLTGDKPVFYTFAFLLDELAGTLQVIDKHERVEAFREIELQQLPTLTAHLEGLSGRFDGEIDGRWQDWGRFRAVIHHLVYEAMSNQGEKPVC